jgi:4-amino-4-deoxy-L-arabinose transferase-like glycosyltransferase
MKLRHFLIIAIILYAAAIRIYRIDRYPVNIGAFEGIAGHAAIQIAEGDEEAIRVALNRIKQPAFGSVGIAWNPFLVFPMAAVYRLVGFDLTHIGIRIVPMAYGILSVWLIYLLMAGMFGPAVGLSSAFLLATTIWSITLSRVCNDYSATIFFALLCFLVYSRARRNILVYILLGGLMGLGSYFYFPARLVPIIVFPAIILRFISDWKYLKGAWIGIILMAIAFHLVCKAQGMDAPSFFTDTAKRRGNECSWNRPDFPRNIITHGSKIYSHFFVHWGWVGSSELSYERDEAGLDPISRWLVVVGLFLSLLRIKDHRYRFLVIWAIAALLPLLLTYSRIKRGLLVVPIFSALGAIGLCGVAEMIARWAGGFQAEAGKTGKAVGAIMICGVLFFVGKLNLVNYFGEYAKKEPELIAKRNRWPCWEDRLKVLEEKDLYTDCWLGEAQRTGEYLARCVGRGNRLYQLSPDEARREFSASEGPAVLYLKNGQREEK